MDVISRWGEEEYWRRLEEEERMWEEQESHWHDMGWGHRPRPDFLPPDMVRPQYMVYTYVSETIKKYSSLTTVTCEKTYTLSQL
jgi:hypothetical protein